MPYKLPAISSPLSLLILLSLSETIGAVERTPQRPLIPAVSERAIEAESGSVDLPSSLGGTVDVRVCATCAIEHFVTDAKTQYWANGAIVSAREWQAIARNNIHTPVTVLIDPRTHVVTRVLVDLGNANRKSPGIDYASSPKP
jgi:hypothetical protein